MALEDLDALDKVAGPGYSGAGDVSLKQVLQEFQGLAVSAVTGFAGDASAALSDKDGNSASAAGGDTLLSVIAFPSAAGLAVDLTGSSSISNDRILIADTSTANKKVQVMWYNKDGA